MASFLSPLQTLSCELISLSGYYLLNRSDAVIYLAQRPEESPTLATKRVFKAIKVASKHAINDTCTWIARHPAKTTGTVAYYGTPLVMPYFVGKVMAVLGVGSLGPVAAVLATSFAQFRLRQMTAGTFYALLHSCGLGSVSAQAVSLASFMSLSTAVGGPAVQEWLIGTAYTLGGYQAPMIGLTISIVGTALGSLGVLPALIFGSSFGSSLSSARVLSLFAIWSELRSFAMFSALRWAKNQAMLKYQACIAPLRFLESKCARMTGWMAKLAKVMVRPLHLWEADWRRLLNCSAENAVKTVKARRLRRAAYRLKEEQGEEVDMWEMVDVDDDGTPSTCSAALPTPSPSTKLLLPMQHDDAEDGDLVIVDWSAVERGGMASRGSPREEFSIFEIDDNEDTSSMSFDDSEGTIGVWLGAIAPPPDPHANIQIFGDSQDNFNDAFEAGVMNFVPDDLCADYRIWEME